MSRSVDLVAKLQEHFSFSAFRSPQAEVIQTILQGQDSLVVLPTGGGKSLCYQLPALLLDGLTVVVSPLIALMKDQVDALRARGIPAAQWHSLQTAEERSDVLRSLSSGRCKLLYVSPERFRAAGFLDSLKQHRVSLFAVDEAHCLSQWGHDFRPDYLRLGRVIEELGHPVTAAFTATATPVVREDIVQSLGLRDPVVTVSGFARPNLAFRVRRVRGEKDKMDRVTAVVAEHKTGIIYCATRKRVEAVSATLEDMGVSLVSYHGGMSGEAREEAQNRFMEGRYDVAVATSAFGMGIDRADIRFVLHFEFPGSVEAYYQEAGRAGRDGGDAICEVLYNYADKRTQEFFLDGANPDAALVREVYGHLRARADGNGEVVVALDDLKEDFATRVNPMGISTAIGLLVRGGYVERFDIPGRQVRGTRLLQRELEAVKLKLDEAAMREKDRRDRLKLESMIRFCESANGCRQRWILEYFGEKEAAPCGRCDTCDHSGHASGRIATAAESDLLRKALSGVARMSRRVGTRSFEPRYGRRKIIQCLLGSRVEGIAGTWIEELTTFGLLAVEGKTRVEALFREMERVGLVRVDDTGEYPLYAMTSSGVEALFDGVVPPMNWDRLPKSGKSSPVESSGDRDLDPVSTATFEALRSHRLQLAKKLNVPAYTIFPDATLRALAAERPGSVEDALTIRGIGPDKARKYLPSFLEILANAE